MKKISNSSMSTVKDPFPGESVVKMIFGNNQWVAGSDSGKIASSTDGLNWRIASIVVTSSILQIIWVNNQWLVSFTNGNIATSPDGLTWTVATVNPMIGNRLTEILTSSSSYLAYAETSVSGSPPPLAHYHIVPTD